MSKCEDPPLLFHFDRNTGTCVDNTGGVLLPNCTSGFTQGDPCELTTPEFIGNIGHTSTLEATNPITDCDKWYFCYEKQTYQDGTCPCGQEFDSETNPCKISTPGATPPQYCTTTGTGNGDCPTIFQSFLFSRQLRKGNKASFL